MQAVITLFLDRGHGCVACLSSLMPENSVVSIYFMCGPLICVVHPPLLGTSLFKVEEKAREGHFFGLRSDRQV